MISELNGNMTIDQILLMMAKKKAEAITLELSITLSDGTKVPIKMSVEIQIDNATNGKACSSRERSK